MSEELGLYEKVIGSSVAYQTGKGTNGPRLTVFKRFVFQDRPVVVVKIMVECDRHYEAQAYATGSVMDPVTGAWHQVVHLTGQELESPKRNMADELLLVDAERVEELLLLVLTAQFGPVALWPNGDPAVVSSPVNEMDRELRAAVLADVVALRKGQDDPARR